jgi:hypothetical protein
MAALGFKRIDAHEHAQQNLRIAEHLAKCLPPLPPVAPLPRPVGRPKKQRTADEAVSSTAAAAAAEPPSKRARGTYTHWFASPYITDILAASARVGRSARRTIAVLQAGAPDDRYSHLSASTLRSWFGADKQLLPRFQEQLDAGIAHCRCRWPCALQPTWRCTGSKSRTQACSSRDSSHTAFDSPTISTSCLSPARRFIRR